MEKDTKWKSRSTQRTKFSDNDKYMSKYKSYIFIYKL
jgi:hypothetical protein